MNSIEEQRLLFSQILDLLEHHFGLQCEIVLHDNTKDYAHTIIDIRNGQISGRKIGDGGGAWGWRFFPANKPILTAIIKSW